MLQRLGMNGATATSAAAILIAAVVIVFQIPPLLGAVFASEGAGDEAAERLQEYVAEHDAYTRQYAARFNGRSIFDRPRPTPKFRPSPPPPPPSEPQDDEPEREPAPPPLYQGPSLIAMFGNEAWFKPMRDGEPSLRIAVGEEIQGLKVMALVWPSHAHVSYQGREYDAPLYGEEWDPLAPFKPRPESDTTVPGLRQAGENDAPAGDQPPQQAARAAGDPEDAESRREAAGEEPRDDSDRGSQTDTPRKPPSVPARPASPPKKPEQKPEQKPGSTEGKPVKPVKGQSSNARGVGS